MNCRITLLKKILQEAPLAPFPCHSRMHRLRSFEGASCFIKRDDELSCAISGSKWRKYLSLLPAITARRPDQVVLIGGAYSNHILGLSQLLIENGIKPILFLRQAAHEEAKGNRLLIEILNEAERIHWVSRKDWPRIEDIVQAFTDEGKKKGIASVVIPEGACMPEAIPGALTLPLDIVDNEEKIVFDHLFVDAGTGMQAMALILGMHWLQQSAQVHVLLLADDEETFKKKLKKCHQDFNTFIKEETPFPGNFYVHTPKTAPSFGSVNREVLQYIAHFAQQEGVFLDPIYSAKLFLEGHRMIFSKGLKGNILFIHSGGVLSLAGFQSGLQLALSSLKK